MKTKTTSKATANKKKKPDMARIKRVAAAAKKAVAKKTVVRKKAAPKKTKAKRTEFSPAQKRQQTKIKQLNTLAVNKIYNAGRNNSPRPTWKQANKAAAREIFK